MKKTKPGANENNWQPHSDFVISAHILPWRHNQIEFDARHRKSLFCVLVLIQGLLHAE
jgi:hypothetical protein